jgi:hypothetical protein
MYACDLKTWEAEAQEDHKFKASLGYTSSVSKIKIKLGVSSLRLPF